MMTTAKQLPISVAKNASYNTTQVIDYKDNPLILALPRKVDGKRFRQLLSNTVKTFYWENMNDDERVEQIRAIRKTRFMTVEHLDLYCTLYDMIRFGYVHRNPVAPSVVAWSYDIADARIPLDSISAPNLDPSTLPTTADAAFLTGFSGNGKSTGVEAILLNLFPTVIEHNWSSFNEPQVVYLKVDLPHNGSRAGLAYRLLSELDRVLTQTSFGNPNYAQSVKKKNGDFIRIDAMVDILITTLVRHHIGLLVIDEFQNLQVSSKRYRQETIQLFDELANRLYIPTLKIGTPDTILLFDSNSRHKRRLGQTFELHRLSDDKAVDRAMTALFEFQPLAKPIIRDPAIEKLLMDLSAGVPAYLIGLWEETLMEAVRSGKEQLTQSLIKRAFKQRFPLLRSVTRNINQDKKGRHADLLTVQQYLDIGNQSLAVKHLQAFTSTTTVDGAGADAVKQDIDSMIEQNDFSDTDLKKLGKIKSELGDKRQALRQPQTLEHKS